MGYIYMVDKILLTKNPTIVDEVFKAVVWGGIEPPTQGFSVM
jgi:hypothetical protein